MSGPGTLKVGFDVTNHPEVIKAMQGVQTAYETLIGSVSKATGDLNSATVGWDGVKQKLTETGAVAKTVGSEVQTSMIGRFKDGILQLNNIDTTKLNSGVQSATEKFNNLGSAIVSNATSFGVFSASAFGVINTISNLEKQSVLLEQRELRLQTATTQLSAAELALKTAKDSGTASTERIALLEQRVTDARTRLGVETAKLEVAQGDYNTSLSSFASQILPLVVNVGASGVQAFTGLSKALKENKISFTDIRTVITGVFEKIGLLPNSFERASQSVSILGSSSGKAGKEVGGLRGVLQSLGPAGLAAGAAMGVAGGFLIALGLDVFNTQKRISQLKAELVTLPKGSEEAFRNMAEQAKTFNRSLVGQIGGALADSNVTLFGTKPIIGFNFREVFKKRLDEDVAVIRADLAKGIQEVRDSAGFALAGDISPATKSNIDAGLKRLTDYLIDSSEKNFADAASTITTLDVMKPIGEAIDDSIKGIADLITGRKVDLTGPIIADMSTVTQAASAVFDALGQDLQLASLPTDVLNEKIKLLVGTMVEAKKIPPELASAVSNLVSEWIKEGEAFADMEKSRADLLQQRSEEVAIFEAENAKMAATFGEVTDVMKIDMDVRNLALGIINEQVEAYKTEEVELVKLAASHGVFSAALLDLTANQEDNRVAMIEAIGAAIDLNTINNESVDSLVKLRQAWLDGLIATKEFITTTKLQHETQDTMRASLEDYITTVDGITIPSFLNPSIELMQQLHQEFINTGSAAITLSDAIDQQLASSFETFSGILGAKNKKEFKDAFKELEFGGAPKDFVEGLRDAGRAAAEFAEKGRQAKTTADGIIAFGKELSKPELRKGVQFLADEISKFDENMPGKDRLDPVVDFLDNLSAKDRQKGVRDIKDTLDLLWVKMADGELSVEDVAAVLARFNMDLAESGRVSEETKKDIESLNKTFVNFSQGGIKEAIQSLKDFGEEFESQADLADLRSGKKVLPPLPGTIPGKQPKKDILPQFKGDEGAQGLITSVNEAKTALAALQDEAKKPLNLGPLNIDQFLLRIVDAGKGVDLLVQFMAKVKTTLPPSDTTQFGNRILDAAKGVVAFVKFVDGAKSTVPPSNTKPFGDRLLDAAKGVVAFVKFVNSAKSTIPAPNISGVLSAVSKAKSALNSIPKTITVTIKAKRVGDFSTRQSGGIDVIEKDTFVRAGEGNRRELHMFFPIDPQSVARAATDFRLNLPKLELPKMRIPRGEENVRIIRVESERRRGADGMMVPFNINIDLGREMGVIRKKATIRIGENYVS